ncbi:helix-turn-helix domain-containing protein [Sphingobacterium faecium]|uniref:helix-turn-helix domain-containing protein n=1 Tax=Sphingobacterium faecium TaxID=34087 RepID=UPI00320BA360
MEVTFGEYIKHLRKDKGLTLIQLAVQLDLDSTNLSKMENNKRQFDEKKLDKLSMIFNLELEKLKTEYFGDQFAKIMMQHNCSKQTLLAAEEKVHYLKYKQDNKQNNNNEK